MTFAEWKIVWSLTCQNIKLFGSVYGPGLQLDIFVCEQDRSAKKWVMLVSMHVQIRVHNRANINTGVNKNTSRENQFVKVSERAISTYDKYKRVHKTIQRSYLISYME
jgi:hypothetical protein